MQILDSRILLLRLKNPGQVTTAIPKSKQVSDHEVAVKWGIPEVHTLQKLNINAPSPISAEYSWPGKFKPMAHQRTTAEFLTKHQRAFCFNEQGTGKTASAAWAADYLMQKGIIKRALVICPVSIMSSAWKNDLFSCAMHRTVDIAYGTAAKRKRIVEGKPEFLIINYDGVEVVKDEIAKAGYDLIIVDEATHYKNSRAKRWKTLNSLVGPDTWLWMMTGTPAAQGPEDAYGLAKMVNPAAVPRTFTTWKDMVSVQVSRFRWETRPTATEKVHRVLQPAIRFTKEECLDLPEMVYTKRSVDLTSQQKRYYEQLRKQMCTEVVGESITAVNAAVNMNKLLQISAGAVYTDDGETVHFDIKNRYSVLKEVIDEAAHKVLVFVPYRNTIDLLKEKLAADGVPTEVIRGDVSPNKRTDIFDRFQTQKDPQVLLIQPQSAAHGVTLTAADTVVWWSPTPSLETYAQANARVHRSGQKNKCTVVQLVGSQVESRIYKLLDGKIDVHNQLINLYKNLLD